MNGAQSFPLPSPYQSFPLNSSSGSAAGTVSPPQQSFPLTFREKKPAVRQFLPLVGLEFDSADRLYSYDGVSTPTDFYKPKVISISEIYKEVPQLGGLYSISGCTVVASNQDQEFSILKDTEPFLNRTAWVALCEPYYGVGSIARLFTGVVDSWSMQGGNIAFQLKDKAIRRLKQPISHFAVTLTVGDFPDLPEYTPQALIPISIGERAALVETDTSAPLPCYRIDGGGADPEFGFPYWDWSGIQGGSVGLDVSGSVQVYVYGELATEWDEIGTPPSGQYTVRTAVLTADLYFIKIRFWSDVTDFPNHTPDEVVVTAQFSKSTQDKESFTLPVGGIKQLHVLLKDFAILDSTAEMDSVAWDAAIASEETATAYKGAITVTDRDETVESIIAKSMESTMGYFYAAKDGKFAVRIARQSDGSGIAVSDSLNIIRDSFQISSSPSVASRLQYNYRYNFRENFFFFQPDLHDAGEETNLGEDIRANRNLWYIDDAATALAVAGDAMAFMRENTQLVRFKIPIKYHAGIDLTQAVTLTHFEGIDSGGSGYSDVTVRILSVRFRPHPSQSEIEVTGIVIA